MVSAEFVPIIITIFQVAERAPRLHDFCFKMLEARGVHACPEEGEVEDEDEAHYRLERQCHKTTKHGFKRWPQRSSLLLMNLVYILPVDPMNKLLLTASRRRPSLLYYCT